MREIRPSGSEGGGAVNPALPTSIGHMPSRMVKTVMPLLPSWRRFLRKDNKDSAPTEAEFVRRSQKNVGCAKRVPAHDKNANVQPDGAVGEGPHIGAHRPRYASLTKPIRRCCWELTKLGLFKTL
jgi:hypothetical protein